MPSQLLGHCSDSAVDHYLIITLWADGSAVCVPGEGHAGYYDCAELR